MVGSRWRVRLVQFDRIYLRRSVVSEKKEKRTKASINLVRMILGMYLECDVGVYNQEKPERKKRKKGKKKRRQGFVFVGNKR